MNYLKKYYTFNLPANVNCILYKFVNKRDKGLVHQRSLVARTVTSERRAMKSPVAIRSKVLEH